MSSRAYRGFNKRRASAAEINDFQCLCRLISDCNDKEFVKID